MRYEFAAYPGEKLKGLLGVINVTDGMLPVVMEVEDFTPQGEEGRVAVGSGGDAAHSIKPWVRFVLKEFTVYPQQNFPFDFSVDVPGDAEPGTYYGTILARITQGLSGETGPLVVAKVGALVLVDVYGEVKEQLSVAGFDVPRFAWKLPVHFALRFQNSGTILVAPKGNIIIRNIFGKVVSTVPLPERNVLPGYTRRVDVLVSEGLLAGRYTATLEAAYGRNRQIPIFAKRSFWFVDVRKVGLPALGILALSVLAWFRRRNFRAFWYVLKTGRPPERNDSNQQSIINSTYVETSLLDSGHCRTSVLAAAWIPEGLVHPAHRRRASGLGDIGCGVFLGKEEGREVNRQRRI